MDKGEIREELIRIIQELELLKSKIDNLEYKDIIDAKNQENCEKVRNRRARNSENVGKPTGEHCWPNESFRNADGDSLARDLRL